MENKKLKNYVSPVMEVVEIEMEDAVLGSSLKPGGWFEDITPSNESAW